MSAVQTAAALIIGNELLSGKIADENVGVLARTLRGIGVRLNRVVIVPDDHAIIAHEVRELSEGFDHLFTSGGVGPTHDDLTIDAIAAAFDVAVERSEPIETMLRSYYGDAIKEGHLAMARAPAGARLVVTEDMPWPTVVMRNVWILPGVPQIFAMKMAVIAAELGTGGAFHSLAVYTNMDEGNLKPLLDRIVADHLEVEVGSYPRWRDPRYRTKVTFDAEDAQVCRVARDAFEAMLPDGGLAQVDVAQVDVAQVDEAQVDEAQVDEAQVDEAQVDEAQVDEAQVDEA
jgi:molybdenum cofactor synthesis domain-containing protein